MTVFRQPRGKTYRYDFRFDKRRYTGNTHQITEADAQLVEREIQLRLRHGAGGIAQFFPQETPRIQAWSEIFIADKKKRLDRPDHVIWVTGSLLRFFGAMPKDPAKRRAGEPYHDLRLGDLIAQPDWILKFEDWMAARGLGAQSKNHYRGIMRRMYALALRPEYRATTGVTINPFVGVPNDPTPGRTVALSPDQVRAWLAASSYHIRLAIAIAALAPKLRLANVLRLRWDDLDPDPRATKFNPRLAYYLTVRRHKTVRAIGRPLVSPINQQLLRILKDAWQRAPRSLHVVTYRGVPIKSIRGGLKAAAEDAQIPYGRAREDGATFHTLRHTAATLLSQVEDDPLKLRDAIGHTDLATTLKYRHLKPRHERPSLERLSKTLQIERLVTVPRRRAIRLKTGTGTSSEAPDYKVEKPNKKGDASSNPPRRSRR